MPMKKRSRSKRRRNRYIKKVGAVALVVIAVVLTPLLVYLFATGEKRVPSEPVGNPFVASEIKTSEADVDYITEVEDASSELNGEWLGVCKKNSIHSVADFKRTVEKDVVLVRHFSGFNWENARLGRQDEVMLAHVSHRKGDVIKQTSKPIKLPKGDGYITDGVRVVRTYCCNDINIAPSAGMPEKPMAVADPPESLLPEIFPSEILPSEESSQYREGIDPPIVVRGPYGRRIVHRPEPPPVQQPVPEPGTFLLMGMGLAALAASCWKRKR
jgi:hypothetical protein